jgi:hypothetical protein
MVVIRRELPRTKVAGLAVRAGRIGAHEGSPLPCTTPAADRLCLYRVHEFLARRASGGSPDLLLWCALELAADRPDEAEQLAPQCGNDLLLGLTAHQQRSVACM